MRGLQCNEVWKALLGFYLMKVNAHPLSLTTEHLDATEEENRFLAELNQLLLRVVFDPPGGELFEFVTQDGDWFVLCGLYPPFLS